MTFNLSRILSGAPLVAPILASPCGFWKLPLMLVGAPDYEFRMLISSATEDIIVVNLLVTKDSCSECFSFSLNVTTFVPNPKSDYTAKKFFDLRTISLIFKDNIAHKGNFTICKKLYYE